MTVQELIDNLQKIERKDVPVVISPYETPNELQYSCAVWFDTFDMSDKDCAIGKEYPLRDDEYFTEEEMNEMVFDTPLVVITCDKN